MRNLLKSMMKWTFNFSASCDMWGPQIVLLHLFGLTRLNIIQFSYKARRSRPFPAPSFICWFFRVSLFDRPAMLAKVPQLSRQGAYWGSCLVDKLVWIMFEVWRIFFSSWHSKRIFGNLQNCIRDIWAWSQHWSYLKCFLHRSTWCSRILGCNANWTRGTWTWTAENQNSPYAIPYFVRSRVFEF